MHNNTTTGLNKLFWWTLLQQVSLLASTTSGGLKIKNFNVFSFLISKSFFMCLKTPQQRKNQKKSSLSSWSTSIGNEVQHMTYPWKAHHGSFHSLFSYSPSSLTAVVTSRSLNIISHILRRSSSVVDRFSTVKENCASLDICIE